MVLFYWFVGYVAVMVCIYGFVLGSCDKQAYRQQDKMSEPVEKE